MFAHLLIRAWRATWFVLARAFGFWIGRRGAIPCWWCVRGGWQRPSACRMALRRDRLSYMYFLALRLMKVITGLSSICYTVSRTSR